MLLNTSHLDRKLQMLASTPAARGVGAAILLAPCARPKQ